MRFKPAVFILLTLFSLEVSSQDNLKSHEIGSVKTLMRVDHTIRIMTSDNREVQISAFTPTVIRVNILSPGSGSTPSFAVVRDCSNNFNKITESKEEITLNTDSMKVVIRKAPLRIDFYNSEGEWLDGDASSPGVSWQGQEVTSYRKLTDDEKFIGLGEKTGNFNRRERSYVNWNSDVPGYGLNADPLYSTIPYFIGIHSGNIFGIFFDNTYRSFFSFGGSTDGSMYFFGAEGGALNYYFFGASTVSGQIRDYTWLTGRMELPPLWSLGYQQSRWSYMSRQQVSDVAHRMRQDSIPCDVIYCDIDYMNGYRVFTWNPDAFSNPKGLADSLKALNMHLATITDPGIKIDSNGYQPYISGLKNKYFVRYPDGRPYTGSVWAGRSHFPDFTREPVRRWWGENLKALTENGVTGFWCDMNEPAVWGQDIPPVVEFGEGRSIMTLKEARNIYGMEMAHATFEGAGSLLNGQRPFVLTRAAFSGIQRYSAMWTGDNNPTDDHMLLAYRMINSMSLTGVAFSGVDIGGFTGNPSPELMVRWMSLGTYTPLFRNHTSKGNTSHEPWAWGENNEILIRKSIETRYRLMPYIYSSFYEATMTGLPVSRTLAINYTHNNEVYDPRFENEFLFGPGILVAPVASTENAVKVYLPEGSWYRFGTDEKFEGNKIILVESGLDNLPVFIKAGAIIPMQNVIQSTADKGDGVLCLNIWYGDKPESFTYYEDDGTTYKYRNGEYYKRIIEFLPGHQISLHRISGNYSSKFRSVRLTLHGFPSGSEFKVDGQPVRSISTGITQIISFTNRDDDILINW
jgi:alpha-glucosidase